MSDEDLRKAWAWVFRVAALTDALDEPLTPTHLLHLISRRYRCADIWRKLFGLLFGDIQRAPNAGYSRVAHMSTADIRCDGLIAVLTGETDRSGRPYYVRYQGRTVRDFRKWLHDLLRNKANTIARRTRARRDLLTQHGPETDWLTSNDPRQRGAPAPGDEAAHRGIMPAAARRLRRRRLLALAVYRLAGFTLAETARRLQMTIDQVRYRLDKLKALLDRMSADERHDLAVYLVHCAGA